MRFLLFVTICVLLPAVSAGDPLSVCDCLARRLYYNGRPVEVRGSVSSTYGSGILLFGGDPSHRCVGNMLLTPFAWPAIIRLRLDDLANRAVQERDLFNKGIVKEAVVSGLFLTNPEIFIISLPWRNVLQPLWSFNTYAGAPAAIRVTRLNILTGQPSPDVGSPKPIGAPRGPVP